MPIVYLDTSDLSQLTVARGTDSYRTFLEGWRGRSCELAFSHVHLLEIRQHADEAVRRERIEVLQDLLPICTDIATRNPQEGPPLLVEGREILTALQVACSLNALQLGTEGALSTIGTVFPFRWETPHAVEVMEEFEDERFGDIVAYVRKALEVGAEAESRDAGTPLERKRLRDLPGEPLTDEQVQEGMQGLEEAVRTELATHFADLPPIVGQEEANRQMEAILGRMRAMIIRAGEVGMQQAYMEAASLWEPHSDPKTFLDEMARRQWFQSRVSDTAQRFLGISDPNQLRQMADSIEIEDCPGIWLMRSVELELKKAEPRRSASDAYDLDHLVHAPHVDLFFTDKRIATYSRQVLARGSSLPALRDMRFPVYAEASPEGIDSILERELSS